MTYQDRLIARKREFGTVCQSLSVAGGGQETTIPAPLGWNYVRNYWCKGSNSPEVRLLPCETKMVSSWFRKYRRFEY